MLQIIVEQQDKTAGVQAAIRVWVCYPLSVSLIMSQISKLSLIDLAGSERASATKNRGKRLLEGANINRRYDARGHMLLISLVCLHWEIA